jgi:regulator of sigma E protease
LERGDIVLAVDGQPAKSTLAISDYIKRHADQPITMSILRDGTKREVIVTPEIPRGDAVARIGIFWGEDFGITLDQYGNMMVKYPLPLEQIRSSMLSIFNTVGAIASPNSDVRLQHMSGPVMMLHVYYKMLSSKEGWRMALWFSVVINVNLALLNLLPIPVLDGGHILLALIEAVRRRPVSMRALEVVQTACAVVIITFMIYIAFFDVQDLFGFRRETPRFSPKAAPAKSTQQ